MKKQQIAKKYISNLAFILQKNAMVTQLMHLYEQSGCKNFKDGNECVLFKKNHFFGNRVLSSLTRAS